VRALLRKAVQTGDERDLRRRKPAGRISIFSPSDSEKRGTRVHVERNRFRCRRIIKQYYIIIIRSVLLRTTETSFVTYKSYVYNYPWTRVVVQSCTFTPENNSDLCLIYYYYSRVVNNIVRFETSGKKRCRMIWHGGC